MFEDHNEAALDALGSAGVLSYVHARNVLAIDPTPEMRSLFDGNAHEGLIRKYDTRANGRVLYVDHRSADRAEFEACIRQLGGYRNFRIEYTD